MTALHSAKFWDTQPSKLEEMLMWIPIVGWFFGALLYRVRIRPIAEDIYRQLQNRTEPSLSIWGEDSQRRKMADYIVHQLPIEFGWPNHHFIPSDPLWIAAWAHQDGLDDVSFFRNIARHYKVPMDAPFSRDATLSDLVDCVYQETKKSTHPAFQPTR